MQLPKVNYISIKDALKREKSKFLRRIWNEHTLKDLGKTFNELNKLAESVVRGNFGALRERTNYYRIGEIMSYAFEAWIAQRPQLLFTVLVQK